jgi:hypothetical protein
MRSVATVQLDLQELEASVETAARKDATAAGEELAWDGWAEDVVVERITEGLDGRIRAARLDDGEDCAGGRPLPEIAEECENGWRSLAEVHGYQGRIAPISDTFWRWPEALGLNREAERQEEPARERAELVRAMEDERDLGQGGVPRSS